MPIVPALVAGGAAAAASGAVAGAVSGAVASSKNRRDGSRPSLDIRGYTDPSSAPVVNYGKKNSYPTSSIRYASGVCDVPDSSFDKCGNAIVIQGYNIQTSYDNNVGTLRNVPQPCMTLFTTLTNACQTGNVAPLPKYCGSDCIQYKGVSSNLWNWFTQTLDRTVLDSTPLNINN